MNKANIYKTIRVIDRAEPVDVIMRQFQCGSAHCVAGWAAFAASKAPKGKFITWGFSSAAGWLGLDDQQQSALFFMEYEDEQKVYDTIKASGLAPSYKGCVGDSLAIFDCLPPTVRKHAAISVLEMLNHSNKVDWVGAVEHAIKSYNEQPA